MGRVKAAIIGSGNIGTDLMMKMIKYPQNMELAAVVGIDPASEGLAMARAHGIATTHEGIEGLRRLDCYKDIRIAFDATSAYAHKLHDAALQADGIRVIDRNRRFGLFALGRAGHARQYRRIHPYHRPRDRGGRRGDARQGNHHLEPGRTAHDHARYRLHPVRRR